MTGESPRRLTAGLLDHCAVVSRATAAIRFGVMVVRSHWWQSICGRYIILRGDFQKQDYEICTSTGCRAVNHRDEMQWGADDPDSNGPIFIDRSVELHQLRFELCERERDCERGQRGVHDVDPIGC